MLSGWRAKSHKKKGEFQHQFCCEILYQFFINTLIRQKVVKKTFVCLGKKCPAFVIKDENFGFCVLSEYGSF